MHKKNYTELNVLAVVLREGNTNTESFIEKEGEKWNPISLTEESDPGAFLNFLRLSAKLCFRSAHLKHSEIDSVVQIHCWSHSSDTQLFSFIPAHPHHWHSG